MWQFQICGLIKWKILCFSLAGIIISSSKWRPYSTICSRVQGLQLVSWRALLRGGVAFSPSFQWSCHCALLIWTLVFALPGQSVEPRIWSDIFQFFHVVCDQLYHPIWWAMIKDSSVRALLLHGRMPWAPSQNNALYNRAKSFRRHAGDWFCDLYFSSRVLMKICESD